jgi:hypothetical protein
MANFYLKNTSGASVSIPELGIILDDSTSILVDKNAINGWLSTNLQTLLSNGTLILSTTDIGDTGGDLIPQVAINALSITSRFDVDNPHQTTVTQAIAADSTATFTTAELNTLTNGSDAGTLHQHDDRYYTITQLSNANPSTVSVDWNNIKNAPQYGSLDWQNPVECRILSIGSAPANPPVGSFYISTTDQHIYEWNSSTSAWVNYLTPTTGMSVINETDQKIYTYNGTNWVAGTTGPSIDWCVLVQNDGDSNQSQYVYNGTIWQKIADVDWGTHNSLGGRDAAGAHPASSITYDNTTSLIEATTVQAAIDELVKYRNIDPANILFVANNGTDTAPQADIILGTMSNPFKTITAAINSIPTSGASAPSSTNRYLIYIFPGTYTENVTLNKPYINIVGADKNSVRMTTTTGNTFTLNSPTDKSIVVSFLTIESKSSNSTDAAVVINGNVSIVEDCIITASTAMAVSGISTATQLVRNCEVYGAFKVGSGVFETINTNVYGKMTLTGGTLRIVNGYHVNETDDVILQTNGILYLVSGKLISSSHNEFVQTAGTVYWGWVEYDLSKATFGGTKNLLFKAVDNWYNNSVSGLTATTVQDAIDQLKNLTSQADYVTGIVYVDNRRVDTFTADGSLSKPFSTISAAYASITTASATSPFLVHVSPGLYIEASTFKPYKAYVTLIGCGKENTFVYVTNTTVNSVAQTLTLADTGVSAIRDIQINFAYSLDASVVPGVTVDVDNVQWNTGDGKFSIAGANTTSSTWTNASYSACIVNLQDVTFSDGTLINNAGYVFKNVRTSGLELNNASFGYLKNSSISNLTIDNSSVGCFSDADSLPQIQSQLVLGGGAVIGTYPTGNLWLVNKAFQIAFDNTKTALNAGNVQDAIDKIVTGHISPKNIIFVAKNGRDTPQTSYMTLGTINNPYLTIQAAVNQIEMNGDNTVDNPYVVFIAPGKYQENVLVNDVNFQSITFVGNRSVIIEPLSGNAFECSNLNDNFQKMVINGIQFNKPILIYGHNPAKTVFSSGLYFEDCVINNDLSVKNIIQLNVLRSDINSTFENENIAAIDISNSHIYSTAVAFTYNASNNVPLSVTSVAVNIESSIVASSLSATTSCTITISDTLVGMLASTTLGVYGAVTAYSSYILGTISVAATGTFTVLGTFFDYTQLTVTTGGTYVNRNTSKVVFYDNTLTQLNANNVQDAIDQLKAKVDAFKIPKGPAFPVIPPSDGDLFYRTDLSITYQYDGSRSTWVSTTQMFLDWGSATADGRYLNIHGAVATQSGYLMPRNGIILGITLRGVSGNMTKIVQVRRNNDSVNILKSINLAGGTFSSTNENIDFTANDYLQVFVESSGTPIRDIVAMLTVAWT